MFQRSTNLIVIHCSATPSGKSIARGSPGNFDYRSAAHVIDDWHAARGFSRSRAARERLNPDLCAIGYHFVIDLDGAVLTGRHPEEIGAHAALFNSHSIGICLVGGQEREARYTRAQWAALADLVQSLLKRMRVPLKPARRMYKVTSPGYNVVMGCAGHRDLSPDGNGNGLVEPFEWTKTCPGFDVEAWLTNGLKPLAAHVLEVAA